MSVENYKSSVEVRGIEELIKNLSKLGNEIQGQVVEEGLNRASEIVLQSAKSAAPIGPTGNLKNSLVKEVRKKASGFSARVRAKAPHAHLVEFGFWFTSHAGRRLKRVEPRPARGFLRTALYSNAEKVRDVFKNSVDEALAKIEKPA